MEQIDYTKARNELFRMPRGLTGYYSEIGRNTARNRLRAAADMYGYSFRYWEETGEWKRYTEIETVKTVETVHGTRYTVNGEMETETAKSANTRNESGIETETVCLECMKRIETGKKTKRFCGDKCRNTYNNKRRK